MNPFIGRKKNGLHMADRGSDIIFFMGPIVFLLVILSYHPGLAGNLQLAMLTFKLSILTNVPANS
jgi:hypothetical protein